MDAVKESLGPAQVAIERFILDPVNHDYLVLFKAARNGIIYGSKVRFPHAFVMTFLFRSGTLREKVLAILAATRQHATNLATFALCYKSFMLFLHALPRRTPAVARHTASLPVTTQQFRKETSVDSFLAGLFAGYIVFGRGNKGKSSVNQQIVIYVFARVCLGMAKLAVAPRTELYKAKGYQAGYAPRGGKGFGFLDNLIGEEAANLWRRKAKDNAWPVFASVSWGLVMWLFRWYPDVLQPSLRSSMTYLYEESEHWTGIHDFLWVNKAPAS